jgi:polar amino acid transport system permease protein
VEAERRAFRRSRTVRSAALSAVSTVVVLGVLGWLITHSAGWPRVQETFFSWDKAVESFPAVLKGLWLNIRLMIVCGASILVLGLTLAIMRTLRGPIFFPLRLLATVYVDLFRGLPLLLLLLLLGLGVPALRLPNVPTGLVFWGAVAIILSYPAYVAEVFRAGIESVPKGQTEAGRSLGLSHAQTMRKIVLPQAVRNMTPALGNDLIAMLKDSSLLSVLAIREITQEARLYASSTFQFRPTYLVLTFLYLSMTLILSLLLRWYRSRLGLEESR